MWPNFNFPSQCIIKPVLSDPIAIFSWRSHKTSLRMWLLSNANFSAISWQEQIIFQWDGDDVRFVQDKHAYLDCLC